MTTPGWYDDVQRPGWLRYWDGTQWTDHRSPAPVAHIPLDEEVAAAKRARVALACAAPAMVLGVIGSAYAFRDLREDLDEVFDTIDRTRPGEPVVLDSDSFQFDSGAFALSQLSGVVMVIAGILFVIWLHRATSNAQALGLPQRYGTNWAWLGFLVPIANFFVPYVIARDALPVGHPARADVAQWWAAYLVASASGFVILGAALTDQRWVLVVASVLAGSAWVLAAVFGRQVIGAITDAHVAAERDRRGA